MTQPLCGPFTGCREFYLQLFSKALMDFFRLTRVSCLTSSRVITYFRHHDPQVPSPQCHARKGSSISSPYHVIYRAMWIHWNVIRWIQFTWKALIRDLCLWLVSTKMKRWLSSISIVFGVDWFYSTSVINYHVTPKRSHIDSWKTDHVWLIVSFNDQLLIMIIIIVTDQSWSMIEVHSFIYIYIW